ncbi:hypothetical protein BZG36_04420 [Bifiguratus adelaidae]|uniref:DASH complex subunit DAM1 n=1 Tax=Bifiguratus adelaidae TaxID=1938954 RepID=A0A261XWQ7_9FUNG|nr:hypothetical protein BZG36_04420 [Bifiguratus adelaidae]
MGPFPRCDEPPVTPFQLKNTVNTEQYTLDNLAEPLQEMATVFETLTDNFNAIQDVNDSLIRMNKSFGAFLFGMSVNGGCVDWPDAPIPESFNRFPLLAPSPLDGTSASHQKPTESRSSKQTNQLSQDVSKASLAQDSNANEESEIATPAFTPVKMRRYTSKMNIERIIDGLPINYRENASNRDSMERILKVDMNDLASAAQLPKYKCTACINTLVHSKDVVKLYNKRITAPNFPFREPRLTSVDLMATPPFEYVAPLEETRELETAEILESVKDACSSPVPDTTSESTELRPYIVPVPKYPPLTRHQFENWNPVWPVHFREDVRRRIHFSEKELLRIQELMDKVLELTTNEGIDELPIACLVHEPKKDKIITIACDTRKRDQHPLRHAVMNAIEQVATIERRVKQISKDSPRLPGSSYNGPELTSITSEAPRESLEVQNVHQEDKQMSNSDLIAPIDNQQMPISDSSKTAEISRTSTPIIPELSKDSSYLCTGYNIYISHEPCYGLGAFTGQQSLLS